MPDTTNVIEVDFTPAGRGDLEGIGDEIRGIREEFERHVAWADWLDGQRRAYRRRCRALERALLDERARNFSFTDDDVLETIRRAYVGEPLAAGAVTAVLCGRAAPTHSARVRTGLALSRLAKSGRVVRHRPDDDEWFRRPCLWGVADA